MKNLEVSSDSEEENNNDDGFRADPYNNIKPNEKWKKKTKNLKKESQKPDHQESNHKKELVAPSTGLSMLDTKLTAENKKKL